MGLYLDLWIAADALYFTFNPSQCHGKRKRDLDFGSFISNCRDATQLAFDSKKQSAGKTATAYETESGSKWRQSI